MVPREKGPQAHQGKYARAATAALPTDEKPSSGGCLLICRASPGQSTRFPFAKWHGGTEGGWDDKICATNLDFSLILTDNLNYNHVSPQYQEDHRS
jgi:hypothetical protein